MCLRHRQPAKFAAQTKHSRFTSFAFTSTLSMPFGAAACRYVLDNPSFLLTLFLDPAPTRMGVCLCVCVS